MTRLLIAALAAIAMTACSTYPATQTSAHGQQRAQPVQIAPDTLCPACDEDVQLRFFGPGFQPAAPAGR